MHTEQLRQMAGICLAAGGIFFILMIVFSIRFHVLQLFGNNREKERKRRNGKERIGRK